MTELERQLTDALSKLSAQFEAAQTQQKQQIETLNKQVQHLSKQVQTLTNALNELE